MLMSQAVFAATSPHLSEISLTDFVLNGNAELSGNIVLTQFTGQVGSAFLPKPIPFGPTDSFTAFFTMESGPGDTIPIVGDGMAFVMENTPAGPAYIGEGGSGLGFFTQTVTPALAVTFDYYSNQITGTPSNSMAISQPVGTNLVVTQPFDPIYSGERFVWVTYNNNTKVMNVYYNRVYQFPSTPTLTTTLPQDLSSLLGGQIYFGFTGGTGGYAVTQSVNYSSIFVSHNSVSHR